MATAHRPMTPILFLLFLLLVSPPLAAGLRVGQIGTLLSLSHSLMSRVANSRASRGDYSGAYRARAIAGNLSLLGGGWSSIFSAGWDFARHYAWPCGGFPAADFSRSASELLAAVAEFSRLESAEDRRRWVLRRYPVLLDHSKSVIRGFLQALDRSGPLREAMLVLQREVAEGELLKDCLEVGSADLEGLIRIVKDLFFSANSYHSEL